MRISFHGAALGVTGSCHLLEACGKKLLVDCGLFQGSRELRDENSRDFGFDPASIDVLLLTHAHLDHCGRIPLLVEQGFSGEIIATAATQDLVHLVLEDTARLQEEEAERSKRHAARGHRHFRANAEPLYDSQDVARALRLFGRRAPYGQSIQLGEGLVATFQDAGHILGSASVCITAKEAGNLRRTVFSGDLGSRYHPIIRDPEICPEADVVIMESTYGGRHHRSMPDTVREFQEAINDTVARGGNIVVPSFALERAQEILYGLREAHEHGRIPSGLQVFVDSPMAQSAVAIFRHHPECFDPSTHAVLETRDPFDFPGLAFARDRIASKAINDVRRGALILAGSGMCTGGRVLHHLERLLPRPECAVIFVGYAAHGTPARNLIDGARTLHLYGQEVPVRARIYTINGFSGHGDQEGLLRWHQGSGSGARTFLVHGDPEALNAMQTELQAKGSPVTIPQPHEAFEL